MRIIGANFKMNVDELTFKLKAFKRLHVFC